MAEIRASFGSAEEWKAWRADLGDFAPVRHSLLNDVRQRGYVEPLIGIRRHPHEITIRESNLHESISSNELNSRKRALLLQIMLELQTRDWLVRRDLRILGAEAVSRVALILRGRYPFYCGTEYLPDEAARQKFFPVPHMDLQEIRYPDNSFDVFISADVFEHVPDLDRALMEIHRVLKPGGVIISSFPFDPGRLETLVKASLSETGQIIHHAEPEYHGNPVADRAGSLVFQLPGWDLLPKLMSWGFAEAHYSITASSHFGVLANHHPGPFVLTATKRGGKVSPRRPPDVVEKKPLPAKLCTLIALPRSGTTLLTSVFAVHSACEAVYEPWNGKRLGGEADARIDALAEAERLPDLSGRILFVKETSTRREHVAYLRKLHESAPFPVEKHMIMLLRQPEHTFLSEVDRRNEWWKDDVALNAASFNAWAAKSRQSLRMMLDFGLASGGLAMLLEDFAARPSVLLAELAAQIGFCVEREQLEYEKHIDKRRVRGDLNVAKDPSKIEVSTTMLRAGRTAEIQDFLEGSPHAAWFLAFRNLYDTIHKQGGMMPVRNISNPTIKAVLE